MIFGRGELFMLGPDGAQRRIGTVGAMRLVAEQAASLALEPPSPAEISFTLAPRERARLRRLFGMPPLRYPFKRMRAPGWRRP